MSVHNNNSIILYYILYRAHYNNTAIYNYYSTRIARTGVYVIPVLLLAI